MPRAIEDRLNRLKSRRSDGSILDSILMMETYEKRATNKATRYAIGAMQEVEPRYTRISLEEAEKVERNLREGLDSEGLSPVYRLQGSVPLNVHTRGVSDVDLLVIEGNYLRFATCDDGNKTYLPYTGRGEVCDDVLYLRAKAVEVLKRRFWGATVDNTPAKSIQLTEGGFRRKVDVVPANWYDTAHYQRSLDETGRAVEIVDRHTREAIRNFPFAYMSAVNMQDAATRGGAKMAIRLSKNVRNDAEREIELSSYDIGGLIYHCPAEHITLFPAGDLMILSGTERWLDELASNHALTMSLDSPDGTRKVIDSEEKWRAFLLLYAEVSTLAQEVEREVIGPYTAPSFEKGERRRRLNESRIPLTAG